MKKTICLWALLLIVVSCTNDDNYNDEHGDKAVIPPKGRIIRITVSYTHLTLPTKLEV